MENTYFIRPYRDWSRQEHHRWIDAGHTFGAHLFEKVRDASVAQTLSRNPGFDKAQVEYTVDEALSFMMALLDGVSRTKIDDEYIAQYVLSMRILNKERDVQETFELDPDGDGLGLGYAGWINGDYGQDNVRS